MASIQDIGVLVESFVSGKMSPPEFANSFRPVFQSALESQDESVKNFALVVHAQISHYFNGFTSEQDFRTNISAFRTNLSGVVVSVAMPATPSALNEGWIIDEAGTLRQLELVEG